MFSAFIAVTLVIIYVIENSQELPLSDITNVSSNSNKNIVDISPSEYNLFENIPALYAQAIHSYNNESNVNNNDTRKSGKKIVRIVYRKRVKSNKNRVANNEAISEPEAALSSGNEEERVYTQKSTPSQTYGTNTFEQSNTKFSILKTHVNQFKDDQDLMLSRQNKQSLTNHNENIDSNNNKHVRDNTLDIIRGQHGSYLEPNDSGDDMVANQAIGNLAGTATETKDIERIDVNDEDKLYTENKALKKLGLWEQSGNVETDIIRNIVTSPKFVATKDIDETTKAQVDNIPKTNSVVKYVTTEVPDEDPNYEVKTSRILPTVSIVNPYNNERDAQEVTSKICDTAKKILDRKIDSAVIMKIVQVLEELQKITTTDEDIKHYVEGYSVVDDYENVNEFTDRDKDYWIRENDMSLKETSTTVRPQKVERYQLEDPNEADLVTININDIIRILLSIPNNVRNEYVIGWRLHKKHLNMNDLIVRKSSLDNTNSTAGWSTKSTNNYKIPELINLHKQAEVRRPQNIDTAIVEPTDIGSSDNNINTPYPKDIPAASKQTEDTGSSKRPTLKFKWRLKMSDINESL